MEDFKYWHGSKNIWEEIPQGIRKAGILDMEIYMINNLAFMIVETPLDFEWDGVFGRLATYERQAEWEEFVSKFQVTDGGKTLGGKMATDRADILSLADALK